MSLEAWTVHASLGRHPVLNGVSLSVAPGEVVGVVGPNGAGKSTLLRVLARLLATDRGEIALDGRKLGDWPATSLARSIAYLPQERIVHWPMPVRSVVALGRGPHRHPFDWLSPDDDAAVDAAMAAMDVQHLAARSVADLSGGERARVLVARALAQGASYIIADEPTAGLDPAHGLALFEHFATLAAEARAVVVALHDLALAARYCHRLVLLKAGEIVASGPAAQVLSPENLAGAYGIRARLATIDGVPVVVPLERLS